MIKEVKGNLLSVKNGFIVHGCNAHGVMGSGVAKQIRAMYPKCYEEYSRYCTALHSTYEHEWILRNRILGTVWNYGHEGNLVIFNAITQFNYGTHSRQVDYEAVCNAFETINSHILAADERYPKVLNFPMIGCGLAGGNWNIVKTIIDEVVDDSIEKVLWIYEG